MNCPLPVVSKMNYCQLACLLVACPSAINLSRAADKPAVTPTKQTTQVQTKQVQTKQKSAAQRPAVKKPAFTAEQLRTLVHETVARNSFYAPGFLISRRDVESVFSKLLEKGVTRPDDQEDLVESVLSDQSPLVKILKTPNGRAFMKKLGNNPTAYDRLERLSWTLDGRSLIERMVRSKDGVAILANLQTGDQLARLSKYLAADPRTKDFHLPTGKAHTADQLVQRLEEILQRGAE